MGDSYATLQLLCVANIIGSGKLGEGRPNLNDGKITFDIFLLTSVGVFADVTTGG